MIWNKMKIEDLGLITSGGTPSTTNQSFWDGEIPWITPKDLSNYEFRYIRNGSRNITKEGLEKSSAKIIREKSILLSSRAPIGYLAIADNDVTTNQGFKSITTNNKCDYLFLYYCLRNNVEYLKSLGVGAVYPELSSSRLKEITIPVPLITTQLKIASILSAYDDMIENNLKRIRLLEEEAQLYYLRLKTELNNSKKIRQEYISDCLEYYIGGGWGEEEYKEGFSEPAYVIRGTDVPDARKGIIAGVPLRFHKETNLISRKLNSGDIVFEVSGGSKSQPVGRSLLITNKLLNQFNKDVMCASFCKLLRPKSNVGSEYFYLYLSDSYLNGIISRYEKHSASNIVNFGFEEFIGEQKIIVPDTLILNSFTLHTKPIFDLIGVLGQQNSRLCEARDILLPRLMSGEIEV